MVQIIEWMLFLHSVQAIHEIAFFSILVFFSPSQYWFYFNLNNNFTQFLALRILLALLQAIFFLPMNDYTIVLYESDALFLRLASG